jgi:foldase protein PrsA
VPRTRTATLIALLGITALLVAACGGSGGDETTVEKPTVPEGAVAVVGDEVITQEQFDSLYNVAVKQTEQNGQEAPAAGSEEETTLKQQVMQSLFQNAVISQEAAQRDITVDDATVDERITQFKDECCEGKDDEFATYLEELGVTEQEVRDQFVLQAESQELYDQVTKDVTVTPEDAEQQYEQDKETRYTTARSREVAHILLDVAPEGESTDADCKKAEEVIAELEAGGDFAELAKKYSADPGSKDTGGVYQITDDENWDADFREAAFALETGELSGPVKSQFGCHVITARTDIEDATTQPFADVQAQIESELLEQKKSEAAITWFEDAEKSFLERSAFAPGYSLPPTQAELDAEAGLDGEETGTGEGEE